MEKDYFGEDNQRRGISEFTCIQSSIPAKGSLFQANELAIQSQHARQMGTLAAVQKHVLHGMIKAKNARSTLKMRP